MKRLLILAVGFCSVFSCHRADQRLDSRSFQGAQDCRDSLQRALNGDTALTFVKRSKKFSVVVHAQFVDLYSGFQAFLDEHPADSLHLKNIELIDVTGDGRPDSCTTSISMKNSVPFIEHTVRSRGQTIWFDTVSYPDDGAPTYGWDDQESYRALKPHSAFFFAKRGDESFVKGTVDTATSEFSYFIGVLHSDNPTLWAKRYSSFKGHWIMKLDLSDPYGMVWDPQSNHFIAYTGN